MSDAEGRNTDDRREPDTDERPRPEGKSPGESTEVGAEPPEGRPSEEQREKQGDDVASGGA